MDDIIDERTRLIDNDNNDENDDSETIELGAMGGRTSTSRFNPYGGHARQKTTTFSGDIEKDLYNREKSRDEAWDKITSKFPQFNIENLPFTAKMDEYDRVIVRLKRQGSRDYHLFNGDGELNDNIPKTIIKSLGPDADNIINENEKSNNMDREKLKNLREEIGRTDISENERERISDRINVISERISDRNQMNEGIQERILLRDKVKAIFEKYGFTITAVLLSVGVVIGTIISNLSSGLAKMAKGVGNGLKEIGKKLGQLLPGMIGTIASFIFKTAGEVISFLAKNAWLLIVGIVIYFIEGLKKNKR